MPKCTVCGKVVDVGYTIMGKTIMCQDCSEEFEDHLNDIVFNALKKPGQELEEIENQFSKKKANLQKFKVKDNTLKVMAARRVMSIKKG